MSRREDEKKVKTIRQNNFIEIMQIIIELLLLFAMLYLDVSKDFTSILEMIKRGIFLNETIIDACIDLILMLLLLVSILTIDKAVNILKRRIG